MTSLLDLAWTGTWGRRAEILAAVAEAAAGLVDDGFALVWLARGDRLVLRAAAGHLRQAHGGVRTELAAGEGLVGAAARSRDVLVVDAPAADPRTREAAFLRAEGVRRFAGVALGSPYALEGVLTVFSRRASGPDAARLERLAVLAGQTAAALDRKSGV